MDIHLYINILIDDLWIHSKFMVETDSCRMRTLLRVQAIFPGLLRETDSSPKAQYYSTAHNINHPSLAQFNWLRNFCSSFYHRPHPKILRQ